jgi:hypothetical protein
VNISITRIDTKQLGQRMKALAAPCRPEILNLFDPAWPVLPMGTQLPLVLINGEVLSSGGKIAIPAIHRRVEALGISASG